MFVPLSHRPAPRRRILAGGRVHWWQEASGSIFCHGSAALGWLVRQAYPAETAEAFCDGHVAAFDFFGGVPQSILYDNTKLAVAKIVKGGKRLRSKMSRSYRAIIYLKIALGAGKGQ